ncbi:MAG: hypothetical protein ACRENG_18910 [bacterium]
MPREAFNSLIESFGDKKSAEAIAGVVESAIDTINKEAAKEIDEKKQMIKIEIKEELRNELITREIFEERFKSLEKEIDARFDVVDEKLKSLNFKLNIFIAIALIALTFANPAFVQLLGKLF